MGKHDESLQEKSLKLNAAAHHEANWCTDADGLLEHTPSRGSLCYRGLLSTRSFHFGRGFPLYIIIIYPICHRVTIPSRSTRLTICTGMFLMSFDLISSHNTVMQTRFTWSTLSPDDKTGTQGSDMTGLSMP